jgi:hypothetical protein
MDLSGVNSILYRQESCNLVTLLGFLYKENQGLNPRSFI